MLINYSIVGICLYTAGVITGMSMGYTYREGLLRKERVPKPASPPQPLRYELPKFEEPEVRTHEHNTGYETGQRPF